MFDYMLIRNVSRDASIALINNQKKVTCYEDSRIHKENAGADPGFLEERVQICRGGGGSLC